MVLKYVKCKKCERIIKTNAIYLVHCNPKRDGCGYTTKVRGNEVEEHDRENK